MLAMRAPESAPRSLNRRAIFADGVAASDSSRKAFSSILLIGGGMR